MTGLLDIHSERWWDQALKLSGIDSAQLPVPQRMGNFAGLLERGKSEDLGLPPGIPFFIGGLDHHVSAIGAGIPVNGNISESTGTVLACVSYQDG